MLLTAQQRDVPITLVTVFARFVSAEAVHAFAFRLHLLNGL